MSDGRLRIAVVDYGAGNLVSIEQGLTASGADVVIARDAKAFEDADAIVVPGVGAAAPAMERLRAAGLLLAPGVRGEGQDASQERDRGECETAPGEALPDHLATSSEPNDSRTRSSKSTDRVPSGVANPRR